MFAEKLFAAIFLLILAGQAQSQGGIDPKLAQALKLMAKHECQQIAQDCVKPLQKESVPTCDELKAAGQCMFKGCKNIRGTDDEKRAATLLVQFVKDNYKCDIKEEELLGGGNKASSLLQKPVVGLLSGLLVMSLGKIIL